MATDQSWQARALLEEQAAVDAADIGLEMAVRRLEELKANADVYSRAVIGMCICDLQLLRQRL